MLDWLRIRRHTVKEGDLSAYLDGQLSPDQSRRVEEHLESCAACQRKLDDLRTLVGALHGLPEVAIPRSFTLTPEQVLGGRESPLLAPTGRLYLAFRNAAATALILLFASIGTDVFFQFHAEQTEPALLGAARNAETSLPLTEGGAPAGEADEAQTFEEKEAEPVPAPPEQLTPVVGASPVAEETAPPTAMVVATPETPQAAEAVGEEEEEGDRTWLRILEGTLGGMVLGFAVAAFWLRGRSRPA